MSKATPITDAAGIRIPSCRKLASTGLSSAAFCTSKRSGTSENFLLALQ